VSTRMFLGFVFSLGVMLQGSQDYPTKPVRMIEPFGAGGGVDTIARAVSPKLSELCSMRNDAWRATQIRVRW